MKVAIVKYNAGNIYSVVNAMRRLGVEPIITDDAEVLASADRVLFPGQGEASSTMAYIKEHQLDRIILDLKQPVFQPTCHEDKVPAIGWNRIELGDEPCKLFKGLGESPYVYFIHSYYVPVSQWTIATANYTLPFSAALHKDNFYATQFHPEKSGKVGEQILKNFMEIDL